MESAYRDWEKRRERPRSRHTSARRGAKVALGPRECRRLIQLGICVALFFVVFVGKGIFPDQMLEAREKLDRIISGDTDFRAAFASLGESISAGEPVMDTLSGLWVDVFGGGQVVVETWEPTSFYREHRTVLSRPVTDETILAALGVTAAVPPESETPVEPVPTEEDPPPIEESAAPQEPAEPAVVHVDYDGPAMPVNASMDRYRLGLAATTSPVAGAEGWWISSDYGWREHPVYGDDRFHNGVDIAVNDGTGIECFADGVVDYIGESPIYGLYTQIDHGNGVTTFYAHCSELLVQQGQSVKMGDIIVRSGESGNATGPHLHFELKKDGVLLNPLYYIDEK